MDFAEKMEEAMTMLHEACSMNEEWSECVRCPFRDYCDIIEEETDIIPQSGSFLRRGSIPKWS